MRRVPELNRRRTIRKCPKHAGFEKILINCRVRKDTGMDNECCCVGSAEQNIQDSINHFVFKMQRGSLMACRNGSRHRVLKCVFVGGLSEGHGLDEQDHTIVGAAPVPAPRNSLHDGLRRGRGKQACRQQSRRYLRRHGFANFLVRRGRPNSFLRGTPGAAPSPVYLISSNHD